MLKPKIRVRLAEIEKKQSEIYVKLGVTPQQFSNWVQGSSTPRLEMAFKLAKELNCNVDDLWYYEEDK